jgi:hypothetical protein
MGANVHAVDSKNLKPLNLANSKESNAATQALLHAATIRLPCMHIESVFADLNKHPTQTLFTSMEVKDVFCKCAAQKQSLTFRSVPVVCCLRARVGV